MTAPESGAPGLGASVVSAIVRSVDGAAPGIFRMDLEAPGVAGSALPGQFVHVKPPWGVDPLLPRPFSVHGVFGPPKAPPEGIRLLFRVVGRGSARLAEAKPGLAVQLLGPLGRGFDLSPFGGRNLLVAGGLGAAPIGFLAAHGLGRGLLDPGQTEILYGAPTAAELVCADAFEALGCGFRSATDDGSRGRRGTVLDLLAERLDAGGGPSRVFAVGPEPMVRALGRVMEGRDLRVQVSLERRMACGLGACRSCVVRIRGAEGAAAYVDVCRTGPVFDWKAVVWDELEG